MTFAKIILGLAFLSLFGWMVKHITKGDKDYGFLNTPIKELAGFPDLFEQSVEEVKGLPGTFIKTPKKFKAINTLQTDVKALIPYSNAEKNRTIDLYNFRTEKAEHQWHVNMEGLGEHVRIQAPLMYEDSSLIYSCNQTTGFRRIDRDSKPIWEQDSIVSHHSLEKDHNGDVWGCTYNKEFNQVIIFRNFYEVEGDTIWFIENSITKLDKNTGRILYNKSFSEILKENNLTYLIIKSGNSEDPLHMNDVQPALKTTKWYNQGDVFLSSRNLNCIIHYRPNTEKVIRVLEGPFVCQHDVDFLNDSTLVFFNNNNGVYSGQGTRYIKAPKSNSPYSLGKNHSSLMTYSFITGDYGTVNETAMKENRIFSRTEGLQEQLSGGLMFVEEQNCGQLWILDGDKVVYNNVLNSHEEGYHHLPNWIRILE